jgi:hypothetical protein
MIGRLVLAGLALSLVARQGAAADPEFRISFSGRSSVVIPLVRAPNGTLFLNAKIQGRPVTLLLDTGATAILDAGAAGRLGLACGLTQEAGYGLIGSVDKVRATPINIDLDGLNVWQLRATCLDLTGLRTAFQQFGMPAPDGVLSAEVMGLLRARIDFDKLTLELRRPTKASVTEQLRRMEDAQPVGLH